MKRFNRLCEELLKNVPNNVVVLNDGTKTSVSELIHELKKEYVKKELRLHDDTVYYYTDRVLSDSSFINTHQLIAAYDSEHLLPFVVDYGYDIVNEALTSLLEEEDGGIKDE